MADTGRSGAVTGIRQKYNPGRQPASTRPAAAPTASKSNQPKSGAFIKCHTFSIGRNTINIVRTVKKIKENKSYQGSILGNVPLSNVGG
jgi:hypothetical protein